MRQTQDVEPGYEEFQELISQYPVVPLSREVPADLFTPISLFMAMRPFGANILLESAEGGNHWGRFSFVGIGEPFEPKPSPWNTLKAFLKKKRGSHEITSQLGLPPFWGGLVGYLGYEAIGELEPVPVPEKSIMDAPFFSFMKVNRVLALDNLKGTLRLMVCVEANGDPEESYRWGVAALEEMASQLQTPPPVAPVKVAPRQGEELLSTFTQERYEEAVRFIKSQIEAGEVMQVVIAQLLTRKTKAEPFSIYRALRQLNPSPYMFYLDYGEHQLVGSSPEVLVKLQGNTIHSRPIAGTRKRGATREEERRLEEDLLADPKERAEHVMLVDLARNDVGKVAKTGTVKVTDFMVVERYSHVMHMVSHVVGELIPGLDAVDVLKASFPAGTVSGAPKVRAMQLISEVEGIQRGFYAGAVGYLCYSGDMDTCIAIRSMLVKDGKAVVGAGAGIVADSVPANEHRECLAKAKGLLSAVSLAERGLRP
jgi:anthranilate synthase component 1